METRHELKFVFRNENVNNFYSWLYKKSNATKKYPNRTVNSLYLDDINFNSARDNLIGISKRKKFRFRWYNDIKKSTKIFFEIKKKINKLSSKEVFLILLKEVKLNEITVQDLINISYKYLKIEQKLQLKRLFPSLLCSYEREYFETIDGLRITIDQGLFFSEVSSQNILHNDFNYRTDKIVVEFKFSENLDKKVKKILENTCFRAVRNSKYLLGLQKLNRISYI